MVDYGGVMNGSFIRKMRRKLYGIVYECVKNFDDENAKEYVERFLEGVSWASGLRYDVRGHGVFYLYLNGYSWPSKKLYVYTYRIVDVYNETRILRKSINRHFYKQDKKNLKEVRF